ncbi:MAG: hypothetical protein IKT58_05055 [Oscillospiraceae bacterium]|nr:hypothetical protein [Oscillospiraceae bacterium]
MNGLSAVIFVPDDRSKTGYPDPTMLSPILGEPLLTWLSYGLYESGIGRFFLVSHEAYLPQAKQCLPPQAEVMTSADSDPADQLHVFLSTADEAEEEVTIITGPTLYLPMVKGLAENKSPACLVSRETLMDALDQEFSFSLFLHRNSTPLRDCQGFFGADSPDDFAALRCLLQRDQALRLGRLGVQIMDPDSCYISPFARFEKGAQLLPGTMIRGNSLIRAGAKIGPWSVVEDSEIGEGSVVNASQVYSAKIASEVFVGPYAHIRQGSEFARGVHVGSFVETKNAKLGENTWASHLSYLGDAEIGQGCNLGCGTATANFDRVEKHKTVLGDNVFVGCNTVLVAPVQVGQGAYIGAGSTITENVPENALGIARNRQSNKKDWASKHKK